MARAARVLPATAVIPVASIVGSIGCYLSPARRLQVGRNLTRVLGRPPTGTLVRKAFISYCRYWINSFRLPALDNEGLDQIISVEGLEYMEAALKRGNGVVVGVPHLGNWDAVGSWFVQQGFPLTVVVERIEPPELFDWFRSFRSAVGFDVLVNGPGITNALLQALRDNNVVALLCDRDVDGNGGTYRFFGEETTLPRGPAALSLRSGATLLTVAVYEEGRGYRAVVGPPIEVRRLATLRDDLNRITEEVVQRMESAIREAPEQWHCFQPNWPSDR